jgi:hypothetical protein
MNYILSEKAKAHIQLHFGKTAAAGSLFDESVFPTIENLFSYLLLRTPDQIIRQLNSNQAHVYVLHELSSCGWTGLGKRSEYPNIQSEVRNGWNVDFAYIDFFPSTNYVTVICSETELGFLVVTAFPGEYAPPFPNCSQSTDEIEINKRYWSEHILLRKRRKIDVKSGI